MTKITYLLFFVLSMLSLRAQDTNGTSAKGFEKIAPMEEPEMADLFRSQGKIYVVIAVLTITFLCLIGYLIYIDIRLRKLENKK